VQVEHRRQIVPTILALVAVAASAATLAAQSRPAVRTVVVQQVLHQQPPLPEPFFEPLPEPRLAARVSDTLEIADLERLALENNPSMVEARALYDAARGNWLQAGLPPNPNFGYSGQQIGSGGLAEQHGVYLSQQFITGGKLRLDRAVAAQQIEVAHQVLAAQQFRVLTDVRIGFYDVLTAQRRLEFTGDLVSLSDRAVGVADALLKAQEVSRVDVLQARIERDTAKILLQRSQNQHAAAWRGLTAVLGAPSLEPRSVHGELEASIADHQWEAALDRLLSQSPQISAALAEVERARWAIHRARAQVVPDLDVQAIVQSDNSLKGTGLGGTNGAIQASFPLPLINRNQGGIRKAEAELIAAERAVDRIALGLQQRLATVFERYASARNQVERYSQDILPNAKETLDLVRQGYQAGEFSFLNLLTAQRTYAQTNLAYIESLRELWSASLQIEGLLLTDSLHQQQQGL
jgi:cobalt-zinc-cadmium efflux system outer membrane protein